MKRRYTILVLIIVSASLFVGCSSQLYTKETNSTVANAEVMLNRLDSFPILTCLSPEGDSLKYTAMMKTAYNCWYQHLSWYEVTNMTTSDKDTLNFIFEDGERWVESGVWFHTSYYVTCPDKKNFFYVISVFCNTNSEHMPAYLVIRTDCLRGAPEYIGDFVSVRVTENGLIGSKNRLAYPDVCKYLTEESSLMHDVHISWNGNIAKIEQEEYDWQEMLHRLGISKEPYLKGFVEIPNLEL